VRRGERSGNAIVEALIELVGEGILDPTAQQVAERAAVGIRTVFRRFSDMERLFAKVGARLEAGALPLLLGGQPHGDLTARARSLVAQRVAFFERIAPYKRAANLKRWHSPLLNERHALLVRALRADLLRWLPELARAPTSLTDALELTTSFEAWDRLRTEQRLGRERAHAAVERMVLRLAAELSAR
jgi:AcrR family transcriptional regulator